MNRTALLVTSLSCGALAGSHNDQIHAIGGGESHSQQISWTSSNLLTELTFPGPSNPDDLTGVMLEVEVETSFIIQWMWKGHATMSAEVWLDVRHFPSWGSGSDGVYYRTIASGSWDQTGSNGDDGWWVGDPVDLDDFVTVEEAYAFTRHIQRGGTMNPDIPGSADSLSHWRADRVTIPARLRYSSVFASGTAFFQGESSADATITLTYLYDEAP